MKFEIIMKNKSVVQIEAVEFALFDDRTIVFFEDYDRRIPFRAIAAGSWADLKIFRSPEEQQILEEQIEDEQE